MGAGRRGHQGPDAVLSPLLPRPVEAGCQIDMDLAVMRSGDVVAGLSSPTC